MELNLGVGMLLLLVQDLDSDGLTRLELRGAQTGGVGDIVDGRALREREIVDNPTGCPRVGIALVDHPKRADMDFRPNLEDVKIEHITSP